MGTFCFAIKWQSYPEAIVVLELVPACDHNDDGGLSSNLSLPRYSMFERNPANRNWQTQNEDSRQ